MLVPSYRTLSRTTVFADNQHRSIHFNVDIIGQRTIATKALFDTGAGDTFIDKRFAAKHHIPLQRLATPMTVYNADHTINKDGEVTHFAHITLRVKGTHIPTRVYASLELSWIYE